MPNNDIISSGDGEKRNNDASRNRHDKQNEYVRAAESAHRQGKKPESEDRSSSWQNITRSFLKFCCIKGAEDMVLEETTEGDGQRMSISPLHHRSEWWNRPDHFTLATDSICSCTYSYGHGHSSCTGTCCDHRWFDRCCGNL